MKDVEKSFHGFKLRSRLFVVHHKDNAARTVNVPEPTHTYDAVT